MAGRRICTANGHVYNLARTRRRSPGVCDLDGSRARPARRRRGGHGPGADGPAGPAAARGRRPLPRTRASCATVDGRAADRGRHRRPARRARRPGGGGLTMVTRKSRARDRPDAPRRPDRRRGPRALESELKPGVSTGRPRRASPRRHIRGAGGDPVVQGLSRASTRADPFPASICISIDDEVVHGIPGERTIRDGQIVSVDVGAIVDGWHGDGARTFFVGEPPAEVADLIDTTRAAMMAGHRRGGARQSHRRHLGRGRGCRRARGLRHRPPVRRPRHRDRRCTRSRRSPTTGPAARGASSSPACAWRSSRCSPSAATTRGSSADGWTVVTRDGSLAAHFEHTIAITDRRARRS